MNLTETKNRDAAFDLLRIMAITIVFLHHSLLRMHWVNYSDVVVAEKLILPGMALNSFFCVGVNVFILSSGYFGINCRPSKLLKILFLCFVSCLLYLPFEGDHLINDILHFRTGNTFMPCYITLFLISPLINKGINSLDRTDYGKVVVNILLADVVIGFFLKYYCIDANGYNIFNFITMYIIGGYLRRHATIPAKKAALIFAISVLLTIIVAYFIEGGFYAFSYNFPTVILSACALVLLFKNIHIKNNATISQMAAASLPLFILNDLTLAYLFPVNPINTTLQNLLHIAAGLTIIWVIAVIIANLTSLLFSRSLKKWLNKLDEWWNFSAK